jgi:hypothetical protein
MSLLVQSQRKSVEWLCTNQNHLIATPVFVQILDKIARLRLRQFLSGFSSQSESEMMVGIVVEQANFGV